MTLIDLKYDADFLEKVYKKYFAYEFYKSLEKWPLKVIAGLLVGTIILGFLFSSEILIVMGIATFSFTFLYFFYYFLRYKRVSKKFIKALDEANKLNTDYKWGFGTEGVYYESTHMESLIKWSYLPFFIENDNDIYLYNHSKRITDIISLEKIGETHYYEFKSILSEKSKQIKD